jgi:hypothetical protein
MLIQLLVSVVVFALIYYFFIPLLPAPFGTIALVILVIAVIIWLLKFAGINI